MEMVNRVVILIQIITLPVEGTPNVPAVKITTFLPRLKVNLFIFTFSLFIWGRNEWVTNEKEEVLFNFPH